MVFDLGVGHGVAPFGFNNDETKDSATILPSQLVKLSFSEKNNAVATFVRR